MQTQIAEAPTEQTAVQPDTDSILEHLPETISRVQDTSIEDVPLPGKWIDEGAKLEDPENPTVLGTIFAWCFQVGAWLAISSWLGFHPDLIGAGAMVIAIFGIITALIWGFVCADHKQMRKAKRTRKQFERLPRESFYEAWETRPAAISNAHAHAAYADRDDVGRVRVRLLRFVGDGKNRLAGETLKSYIVSDDATDDELADLTLALRNEAMRLEQEGYEIEHHEEIEQYRREQEAKLEAERQAEIDRLRDERVDLTRQLLK